MSQALFWIGAIMVFSMNPVAIVVGIGLVIFCDAWGG